MSYRERQKKMMLIASKLKNKEQPQKAEPAEEKKKKQKTKLDIAIDNFEPKPDIAKEKLAETLLSVPSNEEKEE